ncbi:hypothetical protein OAB72_00040 [Flavobacteriales bacterium]|jgi:hypothetical protein|nr:hypothetical protein [Flavobacteriales bacterium]
MKKLILLFIALTTFTNVSYASFPITDTLEIIQDTVQTEDIKRYHSSLIKMGFDLNTCKCESCRIGIAPLTNNREVNKPLNQFQRIWLPIIIIMTILVIVCVIIILRYVDEHLSGGTALG